LSREVTFFAENPKTGAILPIVKPLKKLGEGVAQQEKERQNEAVHNQHKIFYGDVKPNSSNSSEGHFGPGKQGETHQLKEQQGGAHHGQGQHDAPANNAKGKRKRKSD
jgi:hypothetical protein